MKCIAGRNCQVRNAEGRPVFYHQGDIAEFDVCPRNWSEVEDAKVIMVSGGTVLDFGDFKDDVVRALEFDIDELKEYMAERMPDVKFAHNIGRDNLVEKYLYARSANQERSQVLESHAQPALDPVKDSIHVDIIDEDIEDEELDLTTDVVDDDDLDLDELSQE